jgi:hypothetical protein
MGCVRTGIRVCEYDNCTRGLDATPRPGTRGERERASHCGARAVGGTRTRTTHEDEGQEVGIIRSFVRACVRATRLARDVKIEATGRSWTTRAGRSLRGVGVTARA